MQKVMIKGLAKDDRTLKDLGVTKGAKIMVVGSKLDDVLAVSTPSQLDLTEEKPAVATKEPFCKQKMHRKVLDKGIPDDVMPGIKSLKVCSVIYSLWVHNDPSNLDWNLNIICLGFIDLLELVERIMFKS